MLFLFEAVSLVEFTYLVFTRMLGENYRRRLRSLLLCVCGVFRALINSLVGCFSCSLLFEHLNQIPFYFFSLSFFFDLIFPSSYYCAARYCCFSSSRCVPGSVQNFCTQQAMIRGSLKCHNHFPCTFLSVVDKICQVSNKRGLGEGNEKAINCHKRGLLIRFI